MLIKRFASGLVALVVALQVLAPIQAFAKPPAAISYTVGVCDPNFPQRCAAPDAAGKLPVTGTFSSSVAAFAPTGQASLALTTTSARVALPSGDATATVQNLGANTSYVLFGGAGVTVTTTTGYPILPNSTVSFAVGSNGFIAGITATSTSTLSITTGTGVPALAGGGTSSGGGGGAVTVADGADVTQGAIGDSACSTDNGVTCTINALLKRNNQRTTSLITAMGSPFQAGGSIANTTFASTQSGAWNITNISGTISLPTGASTSALQGAQGTGSTYNPPTGGSGEIGYLSGIYASSIDTTQVPIQCGTSGIPVTCPSTANVTETHGSTGSTVPAKADFAGVVSGGNLVGLIQADNSAAISVSTATTTQLVALASSKKIYVTGYDVIAAGTGNITLVYGTGSNCGTGTTSLTGAYNLTAQAGIAKGGGLGPVLVVPASNALCVTTSAAVGMAGSVAYTQF